MERVLPRDAFNDANLLKCIGKLTMLIEDGMLNHIKYEYDGEPFDIRQDESSGATFVNNITFTTIEGDYLQHERPMNSREAYPLYITYNDEEYKVFDEQGNTHDGLLKAMGYKKIN